MKLIKINPEHYVIVNDSPIEEGGEIKEGDWFLQKETFLDGTVKTEKDYNDKKWVIRNAMKHDIPYIERAQNGSGVCGCNKITHSTQPLDVKPITNKVVIEEDKDGKPLMSAQYVELDMSCTVKPLSLQEVKELIGEVDKAFKRYPIIENDKEHNDRNYYRRSAYYQALEDNKEKKYTEEDMMKAWNAAFINAMSIDEETYKPLFFKDFIQSLQPETEWEVEFVDGKLKLK